VFFSPGPTTLSSGVCGLTKAERCADSQIRVGSLPTSSFNLSEFGSRMSASTDWTAEIDIDEGEPAAM
jgi:hypothetical protein